MAASWAPRISPTPDAVPDFLFENWFCVVAIHPDQRKINENGLPTRFLPSRRRRGCESQGTLKDLLFDHQWTDFAF
jgi:hypothetical protein